MLIDHLSIHDDIFPDVSTACLEPNGLLAIGGDLSEQRLCNAYQNGIFPWFDADSPILWWSPDPRAVLLPNELHISHSLAKFIKKCPFYVTLNYAFAEVIKECAYRSNNEETWITAEMQLAYCRLHEIGLAHSVEVWLADNVLVGGLYGITQGQLFCGESMFSRQTNASKIALLAFCHYFVQQGGKLIDCQILNNHTQSLGAKNIPRIEYIKALHYLRQKKLPTGTWAPQLLSFK